MNTVDETLANTIKNLGLTPGEGPKKKDDLGQADFLNLMITQLKNQDPFKPLENGDFIAQMAQFSSVSGLEKLQKSFEGLAASMQSNQALQASTLVGREVAVKANNAILSNSGAIAGSIELPKSSQAVTLRIYDESGQVVRESILGPQAAGSIAFRWDGIDSTGEIQPVGRYTFDAEAKDGSKTFSLDTFINSKVESVTLNPNTREVTLNLQDAGSMAMSEVREIR